MTVCQNLLKFLNIKIMEHFERPQFKRTPLKGQSRTEFMPVKSCERCGSVFITEKECESCGLQFWFNRLGEPLGERSFYNMRLDYQSDFGKLAEASPKIFSMYEACYPTKERQYVAKLRFRAQLIVDYFFDSNDPALERRSLFFQELIDISSELLERGLSLDDLWEKIDSEHAVRPNQVFYQMFAERILSIKRMNQKSESSGWFSYRLIAATLFFLFIIFMTLSFYPEALS
jgi:hypothetical protein